MDPVSTIIVETFEDAPRKTRFPVGEVEAPSGTWIFDAALVTNNYEFDNRQMAPRLIGINSRDPELPGPGFLQTKFELESLRRVTVEFIGHNQPADVGPFAINVLISTDQGQNWRLLGSANAGKTDLVTSSYFPELSAGEKVMVKIVNASPWIDAFRGNRININKIVFEITNDI